MRIRTIKPEFFTHEALYDAERESNLPLRVGFAGLWCAADRQGRFKWEPRRLGVAILPYDGHDFSRVLDALTTRGFIVKYRVKDAWYGSIPSFLTHQIINNREKESILPDPSLADDLDATTTRAPRVHHASKAEGKGREGEQEGNGNTPPLPPNGATASPPLGGVKKKDNLPTSEEAIRISKLYHRKLTTAWDDREIKALRKLQPMDMNDLALVEAYTIAQRSRGDDGRHRRDLQTFLNNFKTEVDRATLEKTTTGHRDDRPAAFKVPMNAPPTRPE